MTTDAISTMKSATPGSPGLEGSIQKDVVRMQQQDVVELRFERVAHRPLADSGADPRMLGDPREREAPEVAARVVDDEIDDFLARRGQRDLRLRRGQHLSESHAR